MGQTEIEERRPHGPERFTPAAIRAVRALLGIAGGFGLLAVLANWIFVPLYQPKGIGAANAVVRSVRAPIDGELQVVKQVGEVVTKGDTLAEMFNPRRKEDSVWRLLTERASFQAELSRAQSDAALTERLVQVSNDELAKYRDALIQRLSLSQNQAEAKVGEADAIYAQAVRIWEMKRTLASEGYASQDALKTAQEAADVAAKKVEQAKAERDMVAKELKAANEYVFIQRDSPIYLTWKMQLQQGLPAIKSKVLEVVERLAAVDGELRRQMSYAETQASGAVISPVDGVVWRASSEAGQVPKGTPLIEIADIRHQFVEVRFQEALAASVLPGARAVVRFSGKPLMTGIVRKLRHVSPTDLDISYAIKLPRQLNQITAHVELNDPAQDPSLIGRECRVLLTPPEGESGLGARFAEMLFQLLGF